MHEASCAAACAAARAASSVGVTGTCTTVVQLPRLVEILANISVQAPDAKQVKQQAVTSCVQSCSIIPKHA